MHEIEVGILILIALLTAVITMLFCRKGSIEENFIYIFLSVSIFIYSGFGISYAEVNNNYILYYVAFIVAMYLPIKLISSKRIHFVFGNQKRYQTIDTVDRIDSALDLYPKVYKVGAFIFLFSLFVYLLIPTFRISDLWHPSMFSAISIHARRNAEKNFIIRLADTLNIITMPFFFVELQTLAQKKKKALYFVLVIIWAYLDYLKYGYLSRYQLMIYLLFILFSVGLVRYGEIRLDKRMITVMIISAVVVVPFLVSFTFVRTGQTYTGGTFNDSLRALIDGETYYPIYYDRILQEGQDLVSPSDFVSWLVCLPIPSVIWPGKPTIDPSYEFTKMLIGYISKTAATYYNSLPSILGEAFMIFGRSFSFIEGMLLGLFIGIYFKFFFRSKKLSALTMYMLLMLATIGRGGATSYMSVLINGSIILIIWLFIVSRTSRMRRS